MDTSYTKIRLNKDQICDEAITLCGKKLQRMINTPLAVEFIQFTFRGVSTPCNTRTNVYTVEEFQFTICVHSFIEQIVINVSRLRVY